MFACNIIRHALKIMLPHEFRPVVKLYLVADVHFDETECIGHKIEGSFKCYTAFFQEI